MAQYIKTIMFVMTGFATLFTSCSRSDDAVPTDGPNLPEKNGAVRGVVYDAQGVSLPMVTIQSLVTQQGSVTNNDGSFILSLPPGGHRLVYSARYFRNDTVFVKVTSDSTVIYDVVLESQY